MDIGTSFRNALDRPIGFVPIPFAATTSALALGLAPAFGLVGQHRLHATECLRRG